MKDKDFKKLTKEYWKSLDEDTRKRILREVFHYNETIVSWMYKDDIPDWNDVNWELVHAQVFQPKDAIKSGVKAMIKKTVYI